MTDDQIADRWDRLTPRQRLARILLVLSEMTPDGVVTEDTLAAAAEGVGAFHGPPMLGSGLADRVGLARTFNRELRRRADERLGTEPFIGANAECGLVYSLGRGGTDVPYPAALGELSPRSSYEAGRQVGLDLASCGYDWALQPSVDVRVSRSDPVIGVRAFGADPSVVSAHAVAYVEGIQSTGVLATAKHFPGHGDASVDSHLGLPVVRRTERDHHEIHLRPFRAVIEAGVASIMTAHVVLPDLGLEEAATFSPEICRDLIRNQLDFDGVLVSDSLRMKAVSERDTARNKVIRALVAGNDLVNIKCSPAAVPSLLDQLETALRTGDLPENDLYRAFGRVVSATQRRSVSAGEGAADSSEGVAVSELQTIVEVTDPQGRLPLPLGVGDAVGVLVDPAGTFAEPLSGVLDELSAMLGTRLVPIRQGDSLPDDVHAVVVLSRGQAGPSDTEIAHLRAVEDSDVPAAFLGGGPKDASDRCSTSLPTVRAPFIDVFGIVSRGTAHLAFRALLGDRRTTSFGQECMAS